MREALIIVDVLTFLYEAPWTTADPSALETQFSLALSWHNINSHHTRI